MKYVFGCFLFFFFITTPVLALEYENGVPQGGGASIGSYEDVVSLWDDCGSLFMKGDGTCAASSVSLTYTDIVDLWTTCSSGALLADGTCVVLGSAAEEDASAFDAAGAASAVAALYDTSAELQAIIGAGVYQAPLVAGTDYLAPTGDGSGLSGVVTSETDPNWPRQANCATITSGCCMDTDNGYLYCWDGDSVEEVGRPGSVDTLTFSAAGFVGSDGAGNFDDYYLDSGNFENTTGTWGIKANGISSAEIATITQSIAWNAAGTSSDGTQCADPTEVTINSGPITYTTVCADNDASTIYGHVVMPDSWDGGTVTMESEYLQTAADTGVLNGDIACMCRGAAETVNNTWGTEIAIDDAAVTGSNAVDHTTSAAMTCDGTCAAGDTLYWRYQMDATGTTTAVATLHFIGWKMEYTSNVGD